MAVVGAALLLTGCMSRFDFDLRVDEPMDVQEAALDEQHDIVLTIQPAAHGGPSEWYFQVRSTAGTVERYPVPPRRRGEPPDGRAGQRARPQATPNFMTLEVRADAARQRIWMVDPEARAIFATLDRQTGEVTLMPDYPPTWATADGGDILPSESLAERVRREQAEYRTER